MSEFVAEVAAVLEAFSEEQRRRALDETRRIRMTLTRNIGPATQIGFETVFDQIADKAEIDMLLDRMLAAAERQEAAHDLLGHHMHLAMKQHELQGKMKDLVQIQEQFKQENEIASTGRRTSIGMSKQQRAALDQRRKEIEEIKDSLDLRRATMEECRRVLAGETKLAVAEKKPPQKAA